MSKSRSFTNFNFQSPTKFTAKFVYNFFKSNERSAKYETSFEEVSGNKLKPTELDSLFQNIGGSLASTRSLPKFIDCKFGYGFQKIGDYDPPPPVYIDWSLILDESEITNIGFDIVNESDPAIFLRSKEKIEALSKLYDFKFSDTDQSLKLANIMTVNQEDISSLMSPYNDKSNLFIDSLQSISPKDNIFQISSKLTLTVQMNKRLMGLMVQSPDDLNSLDKIEIISIKKNSSNKFLKKASKEFLTEGDTSPVISKFLNYKKNINEIPKLVGAKCVGYIIEKYRLDSFGIGKIEEIFIPDYKNMSFNDFKISYGKNYFYTVSALLQIKSIIQNPAVNTKDEIEFFVKSNPCSLDSYITTEETTPPPEPDGVMYNFNYNSKSGLIIKWQIPSDGTNDVKYFQVFRRKSIYEPFTCIAEIDFNDSEVQSFPNEIVRQERRIKTNFPLCYYEDTDFTKQSSYIYAVAAVDAHGFSSGYSAQTQVSFNSLKNELKLFPISQSGASKQYPNLFVDPSLDQNFSVNSFSRDAILDSGHKKFNIYFTPDAQFYKTSKDEITKPVFVTSGSYYSFYFINTDVQQSDTVQILVEDLLKA